MMVWPSPGGESHPHHSGVRLGKCQANRNVKLAEPPAGMDFCWHSAPTALCAAGSLSNSPSREKASQNNIGEFHQRPRGQPRQCVVRPSPSEIAATAKLPCIGSVALRLGLVINSPAIWSAVRYSLTRGSSLARATSVIVGALTGLSMENEIATLTLEAAGLLMR